MAELKTELQPHQERAVKKFLRSDQPGLVLAHDVGTGKTLTSIAAQARMNMPSDVVVPASLRANYEKELSKHVKDAPETNIQSLQGVARGEIPLNNPLMIVDEAHWSRNPHSATMRALRLSKAKKRLLLTASPMYNHPRDIAPLINTAAGATVLPESQAGFKQQYIRERSIGPGIIGRLRGIKPGVKSDLNPATAPRLKSIMDKWVDFQPSATKDYPSKSEETIPVPMSEMQQEIHDSAMDKAPLWVRWKVQHGLPPSKQESALMNSFMSTSRQVSNSTSGFHQKGVVESPKVDAAHRELIKHLSANPRAKAVVYSSFVHSGLDPYKKKLEQSGIPHGEFSGRIDRKDRKKLVTDYNAGKKRVMFVSRAGAEGLDLKGTRLIQIMEPHWNEENIKQVVGRGVRYKSHEHLPEAERHVHVQRFLTTRRPKGVLEHLGLKRPGYSTDEYIHARAHEKESVNKQFRAMLESQRANDAPPPKEDSNSTVA